MLSLTIVIPTRDRCDTLFATLQSCVQQRFEALTILVVDNFSVDETAAVVAAFRDPRIRYVNSGQRLAMSANWEFALGHVRTDHVLFLGDDDAMLPNAAAALMALVDAHPGIDAVTWPSVEYGWPSCQIASARDLLAVPLRSGTQRRSSRTMLTDVINFRRHYAELPFLYKGLVRMDAIHRLRDASRGSVFHSRIPDVYFGIASCAVIRDYLYSAAPFTVNGASGHSNGISTFAGPEAKHAERKFLSEDNIEFHPTLQFCPSFPILVTESLLQARLRLPALAEHSPDLDAMVRAALAQAQGAPQQVFDAVIAALRHVVAHNALQPQTTAAVAQALNRPLREPGRVYGPNPFTQRFVVDCKAYGVVDCLGAAMLADGLRMLHCDGQLSSVAAWKNGLRLLRREVSKRTGWLQ